MRLSESAVKRPITVIMFFMAFILMGLIAFSRLDVALLPDVEPPAVTIIVGYPGASASDVESDIITQLEDELSTVSGLDRIESLSKDNLALITCVFDWGQDLNTAATDVRDKLNLARQTLKEYAPGAEEPILFKFSSAMSPIMVFTVTASESYLQLHDIVDTVISDPLKRIPGVGSLSYHGGVSRQINVSLDPKKLEAYQLSPDEISKILAAQNLNVPAGSVKIGQREYHLRIPQKFSTVEEIQQLVVTQMGGSAVRLRDVAEVQAGYEAGNELGWGNGGPGMVVMVQKQPGVNTVRLVQNIKERLSELENRLPPDVRINIVRDDADTILNWLNTLQNTIYMGGLMVVLVCLLFLRRLRTSLILIMSIPISLIMSFPFMFLREFTINLVSLMSLTVAIGMVVDNAIVVLENITRRTDEGFSPKQGAVSGAAEVGLAIGASTLTTLVIFVPLFLIKGVVGIFFGQFGFLLLLTISASFLVAMIFVPMASAHLLKSKDSKPERHGLLSRLHDFGENAFLLLERSYRRILIVALQYRVTFLGGIALVFFSSLAFIPLLGSEFIPRVDSGDIDISARLPSGTRVEHTGSVAEGMLHLFKDEIPETKATAALCGQSNSGILTAQGIEEGNNSLTAWAKLVGKNQRKRSASEVAKAVRELIEIEISDFSEVKVHAISAMQKAFFGQGDELTLEVFGPDLDMNIAAAHAIAERLSHIPGAVDVALSSREHRPELWVELDREKSSFLGITVASFATGLRAMYHGIDATKFRDNGDNVDVRVRLPEEKRSSILEIGDIPIKTAIGSEVHLRSIAQVREEMGPVEIRRKNKERLVEVKCGVYGQTLGEVASDLEEEIDQMQFPPEIHTSWGGEFMEQRKAFQDIGLLLVIGVLLVYMVMAAQFENLLDPFIIMFSLPLAITGVIVALLIRGIPLSLISLLGMVMLVGIVVNNGIILVDFMNRMIRQRGMALHQAILEAGSQRLRPVLMTATTTIFGMLPMAFAHGEGGEAWQPLGTVIIGGLLASTIVTLLIIPIVYSFFYSKRKT